MSSEQRKPLKTVLFVITALLLGIFCIFLLAIGLGGPTRPPVMQSIGQPFKLIDFSKLPAVIHFSARDGSLLAYRFYAPAQPSNGNSVVLIHGSSATSSSMHVMATAFAHAGYASYALDLRGHGDSGVRGTIGYVGQLEDDLQDFVRTVRPSGRKTLLGFSSGGGFALRVAGAPQSDLFSDYLLISPFLSQDSPTQRKNSGGWANIGMPRIIALTVLNRLGITAFNNRSVVSYAIDDSDASKLTVEYSYTLADNFRPRPDFVGDIKSVSRPMAVLVGSKDEAFYADRFEPLFRAANPAISITVVDGVGHIGMTLNPDAIAHAVNAVAQLAKKN
ncbi:alpha/beta hydrolase [Pseudomonas sp. HMWF031]|nr:alpha/beta hydrolase [Pseudomonas sp. HMWF031]